MPLRRHCQESGIRKALALIALVFQYRRAKGDEPAEAVAVCVRKTRGAVYCLLLLSGRCPRDRALLRRPCRVGSKQVKGAAMKSPKEKNSRQREDQSLRM